jgi:5-methylphenazine-1-carboxylate 1-monooxygenase
MTSKLQVTIIGAGIGGLVAALHMQRAGIPCRVYEAVPEFKVLGAGITLLPHAIRELTGLGLGEKIESVAVRMKESCFFNRFGQLVYRDPASGNNPQFFIHRGDLHALLTAAVYERMGQEAIVFSHRCIGVSQQGAKVTAKFVDTRTGDALPDVSCGVLVGCDGINSEVRKALYPTGDELAYTGINMWRGVTAHPAILSGGSHVRVGTLATGKAVIYPIRQLEPGLQLFNWVAELQTKERVKNDWNRRGNLEDFVGYFEDWHFDWLDVPALMRKTEMILEYPMADRNPLPRWSFGRITLLGDAAHPMYPRGSNGGAQAIIDGRILMECLAGEADPVQALGKYEEIRRPVTSKIVMTNRATPPDMLIELADQRTGHRPFERLEDFISVEEMRAVLESYKRIAGYDESSLSARAPS